MCELRSHPAGDRKGPGGLLPEMSAPLLSQWGSYVVKRSVLDWVLRVRPLASLVGAIFRLVSGPLCWCVHSRWMLGVSGLVLTDGLQVN